MGSGAKSPLLFIAFFTSHRSPLSERLEQARRNSKLQFAKSYGIIKIRNPNFRHGMTILFFVFSLWIMNTHALSSSPVNWRPRPPGYYWIRNFLLADSASVDAWSCIQIRTFLNVLSRVEIFEYVMSPAGIVWKLNPGGEGVLPYMGYIGMCRCEGYGFQAVYSRIGYVNQSVWV